MNKKQNRNDRAIINRNIRAKQIRCIDKDGNNIGVIDTYKAQGMAETAGLDLVQVSPIGEPTPTCKIIDFGKYQYEQSKRKKEQAKKQRESSVKLKEVKFGLTTDINDLQTKAKQVNKFVGEGCQVRVSILFKCKNKEMRFRPDDPNHIDFARNVMDNFISLLLTEIQLLNGPKMEGSSLTALISK